MGKTDILSAVIFGMATLQGFFLISSLLISRKYQARTKWLLVGLVLSITLIMFQNFVILSGFYTKFPHLIFAFYPLNGLIGPLFFLYVIFLINPTRRFRWFDVLHLSQFGYMLYGHLGFLFLVGGQKIGAAEYLYYSDVEFLSSQVLQLVIFKLSILVYGIAALVFLNKKIQRLNQTSSNTNLLFLIKFRWIVLFFILYAALAVVLQVYSWVNEIYVGNYEIYQHIVNWVVILALTLVSMNQPEALIFHIEPEVVPKHSTNEDERIIIKNLDRLMKESKPYLNPNLKLHELASMAKLPPRVISNAINLHLRLNFFEYVNRFRVLEFQERVNSNKYNHYTLLGIGLEVGFNSKASLNRIFKKQTGLTPSEYAKRKEVSIHELETMES